MTYISVCYIVCGMEAFDVLGDPVRRRALELMSEGELASGAIAQVIQAEFHISQPAVSQHLRVLRDSGFVTMRPVGARRLYAVNPAPLMEVDMWLDQFRRFWDQRLDALEVELRRHHRAERERNDLPDQPTYASPHNEEHP